MLINAEQLIEAFKKSASPPIETAQPPASKAKATRKKRNRSSKKKQLPLIEKNKEAIKEHNTVNAMLSLNKKRKERSEEDQITLDNPPKKVAMEQPHSPETLKNIDKENRSKEPTKADNLKLALNERKHWSRQPAKQSKPNFDEVKTQKKTMPKISNSNVDVTKLKSTENSHSNGERSKSYSSVN